MSPAARDRDVRRTRMLGALVALGVVVLDQAAKAVVVARMPLRQRVALVEGFLDLTHLRNPGGVWSLGADLHGPLRTALFLLLPVVITGFALWYSWSLPATARVRQAAIALVVGGAIGNLIDRLVRNPPEVVDFVLAHWHEHYWPAFNLADSAICVGVGILLVASFGDDEDDDAPARGAAGPRSQA